MLGLQIGDGTAQIMKLIIAREKAGKVAVQYAKLDAARGVFFPSPLLLRERVPSDSEAGEGVATFAEAPHLARSFALATLSPLRGARDKRRERRAAR